MNVAMAGAVFVLLRPRREQSAASAGTREGRQVNGNRNTGKKRDPVIDPALEKPLLSLHLAIDINSFWRAAQRVLLAAIPNRVIGLTFRPRAVLPMIAKWTRPMPEDLFAAEPLKNWLARSPRKKFVRLSDLFRDRGSFVRSVLYRRYIVPQKCAHGLCLCFWRHRRLICGVAIMRTARQGDFSRAELWLLRQIYPHFLAALRRIESLERDQAVRVDLEEFLDRLPVPTIILRWNLRPIYQNPAGREFCAIWEKGPKEARRTKPTSPIPREILDRCRTLKEQWTQTQFRLRSGARAHFKEGEVRHERLPHLRATIHLKQIKSAGVARPHFLIECEDSHRNGAESARLLKNRLPAFVRLTRRQQEIARLACEGRSNKEIAHNACLSLPMVKKHLHAVFRKLGVPSRSRLVAKLL